MGKGLFAVMFIIIGFGLGFTYSKYGPESIEAFCEKVLEKKTSEIEIKVDKKFVQDNKIEMLGLTEQGYRIMSDNIGCWTEDDDSNVIENPYKDEKIGC